MLKRKHSRPILRGFLLYVAPTLLLGGGVIAAALAGVSGPKIMNWSGMVVFTSVIFGTALEKGRRVWGKREFWVLVSVVALVHACVCLWLFRDGRLIPANVWLVVVTAELLSLIIVPRRFLS